MNYKEITKEDIITYRGYRKNILGDKFSLYISNYPINVQYLKTRIGNSEFILAELCCSVGVTLEYLAPAFKKVIGVDFDKDVLDVCKENLKQSAANTTSELILGDVFEDAILRKIKADIVIYDIPFWYPHKQENKGNLVDKNPPLKKMIEKIRTYITSDIIIFSPPEWDYDYFSEELGLMEFQQVFIDGVHNRNQIYLGELIKTKGETKIELNNN